MSSEVSLEVAAFGVHLGAAWESTFVHFDKVCQLILLKLLTPNQDPPSVTPRQSIPIPQGLGRYGDWCNAHKLGGDIEIGGGKELGDQCKGLALDVDQQLGYFDIRGQG